MRESGRERSGGAPRPSVGDMLRVCRTLLASRAVVMLSVSSAFRTMTQSALLTFLPVYLADQMGYSPFWVGGWMFALQAAGFAAAPIAGHLSDSMGRRRIILTSMAMTGGGARVHGVGRDVRRPSSSSSPCSASSCSPSAR